MFTGMFYLLMLAVDMTAGVVAAHLGQSQTAQMAAAAIVSAAAVFACYWIRQRHGRDLSPGAENAKAVTAAMTARNVVY